MTRAGPRSAQEILAEALADPERRVHWYRPPGQRARLLVVLEDSDGTLHAFDCSIWNEVVSAARRAA